jgi:hypothetical protein
MHTYSQFQSTYFTIYKLKAIPLVYTLIDTLENGKLLLLKQENYPFSPEDH